MSALAWLKDRASEYHSWLREIHAFPELGFEEHRTAVFVADKLKAMGVATTTGVGGTGVVGVLRGTVPPVRGGGRVIGFRAELDALPMQERAPIDYRSTVDNKFHGCGHDGHTVTLLAAASYLAEHRDFAGSVLFIFQPAEELFGGARAMLADGLFERFPYDEIYALHNLPALPAGCVGIPSGAALASSDEVSLTIHAQGTHGSAPHTGQDGILAAAAFLTTLQQTVTRVLDSRECGVISFGSISGGRASNILPDRVDLKGTIRTHSDAAQRLLKQQLEAVRIGVEASHGVKIDLVIDQRAPATVNHSAAALAARRSATRVVGAERVLPDVKPVMAAEDFAFLLERAPGAYLFMGQDGPYCHHPEFIFDSAIITVGAAIFSDLASSRLVADDGAMLAQEGLRAAADAASG